MEYLVQRNAGRLMIVNIESVPALEALDAILNVPDLDAVLIGPHDLSLSLGIPEQYRHRSFNDAVCTIIRKARAKQIGVGLHFSFGIDLEIAWAREGANFIVHSSDLFRARETLCADFARFHAELGDRPQKDQQRAAHAEDTTVI
jgi:2-keto-3-deoxy-L-rhamnonate aldolase RhmA